MILFGFLPGESSPAQAFFCRRCHAPVSSEAECIVVLGRPVRSAYVNPAGVRCEILTLRSARNLVEHSFATEEETWFEGYSWRPVACRRCGEHLGWSYEAVGHGLELRQFYGLLVDALQSGVDPGRDG